MSKKKERDGTMPPQHQSRQPGVEGQMQPEPHDEMRNYLAAGKLRGKIAVLTGADSGIGRATAVGFAKEGADIAFLYLDEHDDARKTANLVEEAGRQCLIQSGDVGDSSTCDEFIGKVVEKYGRIDILVNNAAEQHQREAEEISDEQLLRTFRTNIFGHFYMIRAALPHMPDGAAIINTTSIVAYRGHPQLLDYAATKGAILALTRSLATHLKDRKIRVNGVAPGPIWTPLIPASFDEESVSSFGKSTIMGRPGQPDEVAPSFIFLAGPDGSYFTGQVLHPNGGDIVGA